MTLKIQLTQPKVLKLEKDGVEAANVVVADGWEVRPGHLLRDQEEVFVIRLQKEVRIIQEIVSLMRYY